ncbi:MAG TPA: chemotaxis protein CheW [Chryseosolibacter sp.]
METSLTSYLTFKLGDETFAANVSKVIEILEIPKITRVPRAPEFMRGVVNLRGNVLSVVDSRIKFGLPSTDDTVNTCIIVMNISLDGQDITLGLIVDAVKEVRNIAPEAIQPLPEIGSKFNTEFIEGMVKDDNQFIMLLNVAALFSSQEADILHQVSETVEQVN